MKSQIQQLPRDTKRSLLQWPGVDVLTVDIVGNQRQRQQSADPGGHNSHEGMMAENKDGTSIASNSKATAGRNQTRSNFAGSDRKHQGGRGKTERSQGRRE
jgi:hypothetical protein